MAARRAVSGTGLLRCYHTIMRLPSDPGKATSPGSCPRPVITSEMYWRIQTVAGQAAGYASRTDLISAPTPSIVPSPSTRLSISLA